MQNGERRSRLPSKKESSASAAAIEVGEETTRRGKYTRTARGKGKSSEAAASTDNRNKGKAEDNPIKLEVENRQPGLRKFLSKNSQATAR